MDPLIHISQDVHYLIFQHLSGKDVVRAFEVSKSWSESVGSSNCMEKIKFAIKRMITELQREGAINLLNNTKRCYKNIDVYCGSQLSMWHSVGEFLKGAGQLVTELKLKNFEYHELRGFHLPKLQVLKLTDVAVPVRDVFLSRTSSLKTFKLKTSKFSEQPQATRESIECLRRFFNNNRQLENLKIQGAPHYSFFSHDLSKDASFKLKSLVIKTSMNGAVFGMPVNELVGYLTRFPEVSVENGTNLIKFLESQAKSLNRFYLDYGRPNVFQHAFNKMPNLTSLYLNLDTTPITSLMLNEKITELEISESFNETRIKDILSLTPNLSSLLVPFLNEATTEFIARNLKHLKFLHYENPQQYTCIYEREVSPSNFYNQLKLDFPEVNQHIQIIRTHKYKTVM